jgi:hypothetical protein
MLYLRLIILSVRHDVPIDNKTFFLVIDFVNLKIKPTQSFRCAHKNRMYVHIFIMVTAHTCINICVCIVFLKNHQLAIIEWKTNTHRKKNRLTTGDRRQAEDVVEIIQSKHATQCQHVLNRRQKILNYVFFYESELIPEVLDNRNG